MQLSVSAIQIRKLNSFPRQIYRPKELVNLNRMKTVSIRLYILEWMTRNLLQSEKLP